MGLALGTSALDRNIESTFELFAKVLTETNFKDHEHLKTLINAVKWAVNCFT